MGKKKKPLPPRRKRLTRATRLQQARLWLATYGGRHVVRSSARWYGVDLLCAVRELQMLGVPLPGVEQHFTATGGQPRRRSLPREAAQNQTLDPLAGIFSFVAGYTPGGMPFGLTPEDQVAAEGTTVRAALSSAEEPVPIRRHETVAPEMQRSKNRIPSLRPVVGARVYNVWLEMLRELVPDGRTHRLSILVASCLQFAASRASEQWRREQPPQGSAAEILLSSVESDPEEAEAAAARLAERLLADAGVRFRRRSSRGQEYSIADDAAMEFTRWEDMPWE